MSEEEARPGVIPQQNGQHFSEAPASFTVNARSPEGFDIMLTLRDDNTAQLMERVKGALNWLADNKFAPTSVRNSEGLESGSGNGKRYCGYMSDDPGFCPDHGKEMKRSQYHAGYFCPARL